jgi:transcription elongation factor Elf1
MGHWKRPKKRKRQKKQQDEAYVCDACGEEIVIPIDLSAGKTQEYVEDCPVCCRPNVIHVEVEENGELRVWAERE